MKTGTLLWAVALLTVACGNGGDIEYLDGRSDAVELRFEQDTTGEEVVEPGDVLGDDSLVDDSDADALEPPDDISAEVLEVVDDTDSSIDTDDTQGDETDLVDDEADTNQGPVYDVEEVASHDGAPWHRVLHLQITHPMLSADKFLDETRHTDPDIVEWFDGETDPGPGHFLLHEGNLCTDAASTPVLLLHGTGGNAQETFVEPDLLGANYLATLESEGLCVYAITFAHPFGNIWNETIVLAGALEWIRGETGVSKVDVVGHSKGGIPAIAYASGYALDHFALEYAGDIRRLVLMGTPIGGMDFSFRHPTFNYPDEMMQLAMPGTWDQILEYGTWKDVYETSIYGGAYDGNLQLLRAWDDEYSLNMVEQDWYTTYYGGQGFISHSLGIAEAIDMGGNFMAGLRTHTVPASVDVFIGYGSSPVLGAVVWEATGPSDGLVFVASASDQSLFENVAGAHEFPLLSHWQLVSTNTGADWVASKLLQ